MSFKDEILGLSKQYDGKSGKERIQEVLRLANDFSQAMLRWGKSGFKTVDEREYIERGVACTTCGGVGKCPYCGCVLSIKKRLASESKCPDKETYPKLPRYPDRNYWSVCKEKTSVIMPIGREKYTQRTIDNLIETATGDIEIIAIFDGIEPDIEQQDKVRIYHNKAMQGVRRVFNEGAKLATGKYLFRIDAHCIMSQGWDTKLKCACKDKTVVCSVLDGIREETWEPKTHNYTFCSIDKNYETKWWGKRKKLGDCDLIEETMSFTGCGWMVQKDYWEHIKYNEDYASWGLIGTETSLNVWLGTGGRVLLRTDVRCAHLFRKDNPMPKTTNVDTRRALKAKWGHKISELVIYFDSPGWEKVDLLAAPDPVEPKTEVAENVEIRHRTKITAPEEHARLRAKMPEITCIMMYFGRKALAEEAIESFLYQTYPAKQLLIVNTHPDPVWFDEDLPDITVLNVEDTFETIPEKFNFALDHVHTEWFTLWDDDDIWLPDHLVNLVRSIKQRNGLPRMVGNPKRYKWSNGKIKSVSNSSLGQCFIYETCDYRLDPKRLDHGVDFMLKNLKWDRQIIENQSPSFIYRWGTGDRHLSSGGQNELRAAKQKKIVAEKNKIPLKGPMKPHWKADYEKQVEEYKCSAIM